MSKFFIPSENIRENELIITGEDVNHIVKVLRFGVGESLLCCDGRGNDYSVEISDISKKEILCEIKEHHKSDTEPELKVTLIQGIPKGSKMDYIIQKTTELGITEIYPCELARCVSKVENEKKIERWQKIAREAAKQSGRGIVPTVHSPIKLAEAIDVLKNTDVSFVPYECEEKKSLRNQLLGADNAKTAAFMVGPEGGFDKSEIEFITENEIPTVTLGKRILRTETAGEAVLAMVMYEIGDIN